MSSNPLGSTPNTLFCRINVARKGSGEAATILADSYLRIDVHKNQLRTVAPGPGWLETHLMGASRHTEEEKNLASSLDSRLKIIDNYLY
jgi:hypothetical protein